MAKNIFLFAVLFISLTPFSFAQNVGINAAGSAPNASAMLDVESTTRGLLIPRISLVATNSITPITAPATSLLVYNLASSGTGTAAVSPGYYYWDGTRWVALAGPNGRDWALDGNSGTTPGTNFLGTIDAQALAIRTNNIDKIRIQSDVAGTHRLGIGTNFPTPYPGGNTPTLLHIHDAETTANDFAMLQLTTGKNSATNKVGELNFATTTLAATDRRTASIESFITATTGVPNVSGDLRFFTNNSATATFTEKMRIDPAGVIGIGTTSPATSNNGSTAVDKLNILSNTAAAGVPLVEITNSGSNGLSTVSSNNNVSNSFNSLIGLSFYNGNTFVPSAVLGQMTTTNGSGTGHAVRGDGFSSTHIGVRGSIPTTGTWSGFGGLFTGGLAYANGLYNVSDKRLKKDIKPIKNALETIMKIKGVSYKYNSDILLSSKGDTREYLGFIAQDIEQILPNIVGTKNLPLGTEKLNEHNTPPTENILTEAKLVDYVQLIPILLEAIKEQQQQIEKLENEVKKLSNNH